MVVAGPACKTYSIHHSLPHRSGMLEALALLNADSRESAIPNPRVEPTVIIQAGSGRPAGGRAPCTVLSSVDFKRYVRELEGDSSQLLSQKIKPAHRHGDMIRTRR